MFPKLFFFLLAVLFWFRKITTDPHTLAHVNTNCPDDRYAKLKIYIPERISDSEEYVINSLRNNALYDLTLIK